MDSDWCGGSSSCDGLGTGSDNPGGELLDGLDSYLGDINDRLIISRMVSDSVVKGIVNAIAEDADERVKMKELEVSELKRTLSYCHHMNQSKVHGLGLVCDLSHPLGSDFLAVRDRLTHSLADLRALANDHLSRLLCDIDNLEAYVHPLRIGSGTELIDQCDERWAEVFESIHSLKCIVENAFENLDNVIQVCGILLLEVKQDQQFQEEIEAMVIRHGILGLEEKTVSVSKEDDFNKHGNNNVYWCDSIGELSKLRMEMDAISKSLLMSDNGLASHGSAELNEEWNTARRTDVFHRKTSMWEGNVKHDSQVIIPENLVCAQFKHMSKEDLFSYLKAEMIKMKRDHETVVHEMTEEYFSLKRKGPSTPSKKDKEFNALLKRIPEVILKLDTVLHKNENVSKLRNSVEGFDKLKKRLDDALSENHHLKGLLGSNQKEVKRLSVCLAEAQETMSRHSGTEMNLLKKIHNLNNTIQDMRTEVLITEEIHKCIFQEMKITFIDSLNLQSRPTSEKEACNYPMTKPILSDSDMEYMIKLELMGIALIETLKGSEESLRAMNVKSAKDSVLQIALQKTILEKEKALDMSHEEKERLMKEVNLLKETISEKEQVIHEATTAWIKTKENLDVVNREVTMLKENVNVQKLLASGTKNEIVDLKSRLALECEQKSLLEVQINELNDRRKCLLVELNKMNEERVTLHSRSENNQHALSSLVREKEEHRLHLDSMLTLVHGLTREIGDFECRVARDAEIKSSRFGSFTSRLIYLCLISVSHSER